MCGIIGIFNKDINASIQVLENQIKRDLVETSD